MTEQERTRKKIADTLYTIAIDDDLYCTLSGYEAALLAADRILILLGTAPVVGDYGSPCGCRMENGVTVYPCFEHYQSGERVGSEDTPAQPSEREGREALLDSIIDECIACRISRDGSDPQIVAAINTARAENGDPPIEGARGMAPREQAPDANCLTLPDGSCIGKDCIHDTPSEKN